MLAKTKYFDCDKYLSRQNKNTFVRQKDVFCRDIHVLVATKGSLILSREMFVVTGFVAPKICLSRQMFCYDKHTFVAR